MKYLLLIGVIFFAFTQTGCYYDKEELLNPGSACDTTIVTYSGSINPILVANCTGCHSGANAPNGVVLDNYAGAKTQVTANKLVGVITHASGFDPMPKNGNKISDCSIAKITKWVAAGAPNN